MFGCIPLGKVISEMTYTVSGGTLNPTHSLFISWYLVLFNMLVFYHAVEVLNNAFLYGCENLFKNVVTGNTYMYDYIA